jgi:hypothetical protein
MIALHRQKSLTIDELIEIELVYILLDSKKVMKKNTKQVTYDTYAKI